MINTIMRKNNLYIISVFFILFFVFLFPSKSFAAPQPTNTPAPQPTNTTAPQQPPAGGDKTCWKSGQDTCRPNCQQLSNNNRNVAFVNASTIEIGN